MSFFTNLKTFSFVNRSKRGKTVSVNDLEHSVLVDLNTLSQSLLFTHKVTLTSAQLSTGNSVPIDSGLPLPGEGKAYELVSGTTFVYPGSTPFAGNTSVRLGIDTADTTQMTSGTILNSTSNASSRMGITTNNSDNTNQAVENKKIYVTSSADHVSGNGSVVIYFTYRIIDL